MKTVLAYIQVITSVEISRNVLIVIILPFLSSAAVSFANQSEPAVLPTPLTNSVYFPCSRCHTPAGTVPGVRKEDAHLKIRVEGHTEKEYGCFGCHDREFREKLKLFNGSKIDVSVSSELCGQCHSTNYKLWQSGLHGKVVGMWNGVKKITPCTTCHDPHRPGFDMYKPEPPPTPPENTLRWRK